MLPMDMDPRGADQIGRTLVRVGLGVIIVGAIIAAAIALTPTGDDGALGRQNVSFALLFCLGPALLAGLISILVGRSMSRHKPQDDIGSLYRGDYRK